MDDKLKNRIRSHLKANEGEKPQPYRDTNNHLTVGVGINVSRKADFVALKFQTKDAKTGEMRDATEQEKEDEFHRLSKMNKEAIRDDTKRFSLPKTEIDSKLDEKIAEHEAGVKRQIGEADWNKLTDGQKTTVLDVHYANEGGLDDFPNLKVAIKKGDARGMAFESDFHGGQIDGTSHQHRNFDRMRRNRAAMRGIDPESDEAYGDVADSYPDHPSLPDKYNKQRVRSVPPAPRPQDAPEESISPQQPGNSTSTAKPEQPPQSEPPAAPPQPAADQPEAPQEQKQSKAPADPRTAEMLAASAQPVANLGRSALLKPVDTLTEGEMMDMIHSAQGDYRGWRSGDPLKAHTYEKVQDWHLAMYGDGPQANDGGKPVEPTPIRAIPQSPSPHTTPDGRDLWQVTAKIGQQVADAAQTDGHDKAVSGLQRGLNMLNQAHPLPERSTAYGPYTKLGGIAEDGQYGPQTDFALKHATARLGPDKVAEGLALGRFNTFVRDAQSKGDAQGLEDKTHAILGPLFRGPADTASPKVEAGALQATLNGFGQNLKQDDWIGPKTTQAFAQVLRQEDADQVTQSLGRSLGWL